jgi:hypothetical protein
LRHLPLVVPPRRGAVHNPLQHSVATSDPAVLHAITVIDHEHQERHGTGRKHARFESESPKVTFFFLHPQGSGKEGCLRYSGS